MRIPNLLVPFLCLVVASCASSRNSAGSAPTQTSTSIIGVRFWYYDQSPDLSQNASILKGFRVFEVREDYSSHLVSEIPQPTSEPLVLRWLPVAKELVYLDARGTDDVEGDWYNSIRISNGSYASTGRPFILPRNPAPDKEGWVKSRPGGEDGDFEIQIHLSEGDEFVIQKQRLIDSCSFARPTGELRSVSWAPDGRSVLLSLIDEKSMSEVDDVPVCRLFAIGIKDKSVTYIDHGFKAEWLDKDTFYYSGKILDQYVLQAERESKEKIRKPESGSLRSLFVAGYSLSKGHITTRQFGMQLAAVSPLHETVVCIVVKDVFSPFLQEFNVDLVNQLGEGVKLNSSQFTWDYFYDNAVAAP